MRFFAYAQNDIFTFLIILRTLVRRISFLNFVKTTKPKYYSKAKCCSGGKMNIKTHNKINPKLSGEVIEIAEGKTATVKLETNEDMLADDKGLIHGGFIFSAADYCAMITINHSNVVLGSAEVKFIKPLKIGETAFFKSEVLSIEGKKVLVKVDGFKNENKFFEGTFKCYVLDKHVLEP
jgi:acyl-coenzyme A thioesterase PaaI-like protein